MSGLQLVTGPTQEPLTLEQAKLHARIDTDDDDKLIMPIITAARQWIEGQTRRALVTQTWDYEIDYGWPYTQSGIPTIVIPKNPVQSITSITYQDNAGTSPQPTLASSQYTVVNRKHRTYIVPAYDVTWPDIRCVPACVTIRFVAGEAIGSVPEQLIEAMKLLVTHFYERRDLTTEKQLTEVPFSVEALISPYRAGIFAP